MVPEDHQGDPRAAASGDRADADAAVDLALTARIDRALPQTQCRRCGYPSCHDYARAITESAARINRCPPGGAQGIARLAAITGQPVEPLDPDCGVDGPRHVAWIVEAHCIGCTLCIAACPVDCIIGAPKRMHTVIEPECTGCDLCRPACPVDCIVLESVTPGRSGWQAWTDDQACASKVRFDAREARRSRLAVQRGERLLAEARHKLDDLAAASRVDDAVVLARKRELVEAAVRRAQERLAAGRNDCASRLPKPTGKIEP